MVYTVFAVREIYDPLKLNGPVICRRLAPLTPIHYRYSLITNVSVYDIGALHFHVFCRVKLPIIVNCSSAARHQVQNRLRGPILELGGVGVPTIDK